MISGGIFMKTNIIFCILLSIAILVSGCSGGVTGKAVACNKPYIQVGTECCLDKDDSSICDKDEVVIQEEKKVEEPPVTQEVKAVETPARTYSLEQLKKDISTVYKKEVVFRDNKLGVNKIYDDINNSNYHFYDSTYVTIIQIANPSMNLNNFDEFKAFMDEYAKKKFELFVSLNEHPSDYEVIPIYFTKVHDGTNGKIIEYNQRAKVFKLFVGKETTSKQLQTPYGGAVLYIMCSPDLVAAVYPNDIASAGTSWSSLKEPDYDAMLENQLKADRDNAMEEADELLGLCNGQ